MTDTTLRPVDIDGGGHAQLDTEGVTVDWVQNVVTRTAKGTQIDANDGRLRIGGKAFDLHGSIKIERSPGIQRVGQVVAPVGDDRAIFDA